MWMVRVSKLAPLVKLLMTKSSKDSVKAMIRPVTMPGDMNGSSTLKNDCIGVQPRSMAASGTLRSSWLILGSTLMIT